MTQDCCPKVKTTRRIEIFRQTYETKVYLVSEADGNSYINTGIPFLDHLLCQISLNSGFHFSLCSVGDVFIDKHHLVEDVGITIGMAIRRLTNNYNDTLRYGCSFIPLDESLSRVTLDFSGRTEVVCRSNIGNKNISTFSVRLVFELLNAISRAGNMTISVEAVRGRDSHHQLETVWKSFGRAMRSATGSNRGARLSTKGIL